MDNTSENPPGNQPEPSPAPEVTAQPVNQKLCAQCGTLNIPDAKFCYKCGQPLPDASAPAKKFCAGCNAVNDAASQYCLKCGLKLPDVSVSGTPQNYGGFWIRVVAFIIDNLILSTVTGIISLPFYLPLMKDFIKQFGSNYTDYYYLDNLINSDLYLRMISVALLFGFVRMALYCAYYTIGVGKWGTTIGKTALGMKIVRTDGSRVSNWRAFARYWANSLNSFTLGLSFLVVAFNGKKQGIHDMICDTLVVKKN